MTSAAYSARRVTFFALAQLHVFASGSSSDLSQNACRYRCRQPQMTTSLSCAMPAGIELFRIDCPEDDNLPNILALSNTIFSADRPTKHGSLLYWQNHLKHISSCIIYLAPTSTPDKPVAFVFVIPRTTTPPLKNGATESLHIWLAGVLPECRAGGCFTRLMSELGDADQLTVCTFPSRFPQMWRWLTSRGWVQERELGDGKVLLSKPRVAH